MPELGPPKTRRCHVRPWLLLYIPHALTSFACQFFDSEGRQVQSGCSRRPSACHFIHPSEPEWSTRHTDNRRYAGEGSSRRSLASSSSYHGRERRRSPSVDRQRAAPDSGPKRRRTPPRGSSAHHSDRDQPRSPLRGASPPRGRGSLSTNRDVRPLPHRSSSHDLPHPNPQPDHAPKSTSKPTLPKMGSGDHSSGKEITILPVGSFKSPALPTLSTAPKASSEATSTIPSGSAKMPPRSFSEVLPPPPMNFASRDEMTPEQRRAVWERRVA